MKILIPHLRYTVEVKDISKYKGKVDFLGMVEDAGVTGCIMWLPFPIKRAILVHELIHVLQDIYEKKEMVMEDEIEHTAYLMEWLYEEILRRGKK